MRTGIRLCLVTGWRAVPAHLPAGVLRVERALLGAQVREALAELELPYELVSCGKGSRHRSAPPPGTHAVSFQTLGRLQPGLQQRQWTSRLRCSRAAQGKCGAAQPAQPSAVVIGAFASTWPSITLCC